MFPYTRLRRLRSKPKLRDLVRETRLDKGDLIYPIFVKKELFSPENSIPIPGARLNTLESAVEEARRAIDMGLPGIMLFGIPQIKDEKGSGAYSREGIAQKALKSIKEETGDDLIIIADLCLCGYTAHGHCGLFNGSEVLNDETLELYGMIAVSQAEAGADIVAPSGMMDGMVRAIRMALDDSGFNEVLILSYSAKFCSSFFEPFRDVMDSHPTEMGRETYQLDPGNLREALREVQLDVDEGADIVMVKPAMPYLDVIREVRRRFDLPIAAYQVSGEHALLKAGIIDYEKALMESLTSIRRAGADMIITYGAMDAAGIMKRQA